MNRIFVGLCRDELAIFSDWGSSDASTSWSQSLIFSLSWSSGTWEKYESYSMIKENCVVFSRSGKEF
jgi:hypothetical protein